ncbi:MAG: glycosyltransferase [Xenococcus sp. MO_188.B8]|nr:glycosyltransferase [Xenococcus sp. MO_188.B8]
MPKLLTIATVPETLTGFLMPFTNYFRAQGWRVDGIAQKISADPQSVAVFDHVWDVEWSRNPLDPKNLIIAVPRIQELVARENYDIVHVHTPVAAFVTRYALRNWPKTKKTQIIYTAHGFHFHQQGNWLANQIFLVLEKLSGNWTDYLIVINREDELAAQKYQILPRDRIFYTPGIGLDTDYYHPKQVSPIAVAAVRAELGLTPQDSLLLCVAEFTPNKRHRDQLQALKKLNRSDIHLAFAGNGQIKSQTESLAAQLGLAKQVHFLGFRSDIPVLIRASRATLLTSQREGLPRSIMEALCLATPVIGTKIRGINDLLADNCGLLVEVGDIDALAQAMAWIVDNPDSAIQMGQRGQSKIAEYDINKIVQLYAKLYDRALNNNTKNSINLNNCQKHGENFIY